MILTIDFETYFDKDFSLAKIPTSEYVRSDRFKIFGAAVQVNSGTPRWFDEEALRDWFERLEPSSTTIIAHNAAFEGLILSHHFNFVPKRYICTLSMARPLHGADSRLDLDTLGQLYGFPPKEVDILDLKGVETPSSEQWEQLKTRAIGDVERTYRIYGLMNGIFPPAELDLIDTTVRMFADPKVLIDTKLVASVARDDAAQREAKIKASGLAPEVLRSNAKFAAALEERGIKAPTKISPRTLKEAYAFAKTDLEFQAWRDHPGLGAFYEARLAAKTTQTSSKTNRMLKLGENGQRAPLMLNYCAAHTFRWGGGDKFNPQNLKRGSPLRRAIRAPLGYVLSVVDSSQIEARVNAWFAGQHDVLETFRANQDPYLRFARIVYPNLPWTDDDEVDAERFPKERFIGKVCILGLGYGMGWVRLKDTLAMGAMGQAVQMTDVECSNLVTLYRLNNDRIRANWKALDDCLPLMREDAKGPAGFARSLIFRPGGVIMPNGLEIRYPDLQEDSEGQWTYKQIDRRTGNFYRPKIYGAYLCENLVQSMARIIIGDHINQIAKYYPVVLTVHDEIVSLVPRNFAEEAQKWITNVCSKPPAWCPDLPLATSGGYSEVYSK